MSTSLPRRQRLKIARSLPSLRCPGCGTPLERVAIVSAHIRRCDERLAEQERRLEALIG